MKAKDKNYAKLVFQLVFICKKLKKYLSEDEIARLIATGLKESEVQDENI